MCVCQPAPEIETVSRFRGSSSAICDSFSSAFVVGPCECELNNLNPRNSGVFLSFVRRRASPL